MTAASSPVRPIKLYGYRLSGHAHRVELFLSLLGLPMQYIDVDLRAGRQKQPEFLALNKFGQVPVIDDDGFVLADSNAILVYLAAAYGGETWLPRDARSWGRVQRWLSVAAGPLASGPAAARRSLLFAGKQHAEAVALSHELLRVIEAEVADQSFLAGSAATIADLALYTYIAHAPEGGVALDAYPHVRDWLSRIERLPGFVGMAKAAS